MRVLVAPDRFSGSLSAYQVARAMADGWTATAPDDVVDELPLSDGGAGFVSVLAEHVPGELVGVEAIDPFGAATQAQVLVCRKSDPPTVYVETASAVGAHLAAGDAHHAATATSYGVGELIRRALGFGCRRVVIGVGPAATTDGGAGMLAALGAQPAAALVAGGTALESMSTVDLSAARELVADFDLVAATDVGSPLMGSDGAAHGQGVARGIDRGTRERLESAMRTWATATHGGAAVSAGAGAGGGIGFGLLLLGARRVAGAELVAQTVGLPGRVRGADLVLTGEETFDWQSLRGKVVATVAHAAQAAARPVVLLAGRVDVGRRELAARGIDSSYAVADLPADDRRGDPYDDLQGLSARVARSWSR